MVSSDNESTSDETDTLVIGEDDITSDMSSQDDIRKYMDEYWKTKELELNKKYDEKFTNMNDKLAKAMEQIPDNDLLDKQHDLITDLTGSAIDQCEKLCNEVEDKVRSKGQEYVNSLTKQLDNEESRRSKENVEFWNELKKEMGIVYNRLLDTNKTAINNINILNKKLSIAETKMETLNKVAEAHRIKTETLQSTISNDNADMDKVISNETRARRLMNTLDTIEERTTKLMANADDIEKATNKMTDIGLKLTRYEMEIDEITTRVAMIDTTMDNIKNTNESKTVQPSYQKDDDTRNDHKNDNREEQNDTMFMNKYAINMDPNSNHPILTPFQYLYPRDNHTPREIDSHKFQKAKMAMACPSEEYIFTFYNTLRLIAGSFNILLNPLQLITKETGICLLSQSNCIGYTEAYNTMATALHLKLTTNGYFKGFPVASTYIQAAANSNDGFKLLYRILEIIHPKLRAEKGGIHKIVEAPAYADVTDDNIYTFMTKYKNYLLYEELSPEARSYSTQEQAMFVVTALKRDSRFKPGLEYVLATLLSYQRERRINIASQFPLDIELDEIAVTICERCEEYTIGEKKMATTMVVNPYAIQGTINVAKGKKYDWKKKTNNFHDNKNNTKNTQTCASCGGTGHCITNPDTICYATAKENLCCIFIAKEENAKVVKSNSYRYKKSMKERMQHRKMTNRLDGIVRKMEDSGESRMAIDPIINLAKVLQSQDTDDENSNSDESSTASYSS